MQPAIIKFLSEILKRALPTKGLMTNDETLKTPIKTPISASADPDLERKIGRVGIRT
jgi:hypothetical protein